MYLYLNCWDCTSIDYRIRELEVVEARVWEACNASLCYHLVQVMHDKGGHVSAGS